MADGGSASFLVPEVTTRPLHIVHMLTRFLRAGSEENTVATALWQVANGHRVTLIHGADHDPTWARDLAAKVHLVAVSEMIHPVRPLADWRAVKALRHVLKNLDPDVIHTHQSKAGILGRAAATVVPRAVVVHSVHILPWVDVGAVTRAGYIVAERIAARGTDLFIAVSSSVAEATLDAGIGEPDRMHVVHSGMNLGPFRNASPPTDAARLTGAERLGGARPPIVLMLAAFEPRKRHVAFLNVFHRIVARVPDVRLLLAGAGPEEQTARAAVQRLGLSDHVVFCGHRPDPASLIALADLTVLASSREGLPRVAVQSIAAGCPIVTTRLPGITEIVRDGVNGCITDPDDLSATADKIATLLIDRPALNRLRSGARATDVSLWSLDRLGGRTTALYQTALQERMIA